MILSKLNDFDSKNMFLITTGSMISGAMQVAVDDVNADKKLLANYTLSYIFSNTCGDEKQSILFI